jgi:hypothetical protein
MNQHKPDLSDLWPKPPNDAELSGPGGLKAQAEACGYETNGASNRSNQLLASYRQ